MRASRTSTALTVGTLVGVVLALLPASLASATSTAVQCGTVLTKSTVLKTDLTCDASSDALVIGADNVTLNLNGHTLTGPGAYETPYAGVRAAGRKGAKVLNGKITGFQGAVVLDESTKGLVSGLNAYGNDQGVVLATGGSHVVLGNHLHDNGRDAVTVSLSARNRISLNVVSGNTFGITVSDGSSDNVVDLNALSRNGDFGIALFAGDARNRVENNVVDQSVGHGIQVNADSVDAKLVKNRVTRNGIDGIHFESTTTTITKNTAQKNADHGIYAPGAIDGGGNKASGNGNAVQCEGVSCS